MADSETDGDCKYQMVSHINYDTQSILGLWRQDGILASET